MNIKKMTLSEDILNFSLGINSDANKSNISYVSILRHILSSSKAEMNTKVNAVRLDKVHVGSSTVRKEKRNFRCWQWRNNRLF